MANSSAINRFTRSTCSGSTRRLSWIVRNGTVGHYRMRAYQKCGVCVVKAKVMQGQLRDATCTCTCPPLMFRHLIPSLPP